MHNLLVYNTYTAFATDRTKNILVDEQHECEVLHWISSRLLDNARIGSFHGNLVQHVSVKG